MPRNPNGDYTLPSGNPVVSGTIIDTDWANPTLADIANEITNSLSREGEGGMLVPLKFISGSVTSPGISWINEIRTGFYLAGASDFRSTVNGVDSMRWTADNGVQIWNVDTLLWETVATLNDTTNFFKEVIPVIDGQTDLFPSIPFKTAVVLIDGDVQAEGAGAYTVDADAQRIVMSEPFRGNEIVEVWLGDIDVTSLEEADLVTSVFTRIGDVIAEIGDYAAFQIDYSNGLTPGWIATEVQTALENAYSDIQFLAGSLVLKGVWDADANVPDLVAEPKISGNYWLVTVEGSSVLPLFPGAPAHILPWLVSDRVLYLEDNGDTGFAQLRPDSGVVTSVFNRVGAVTAQNEDYNAFQVFFDNTTTNLLATNVQHALEEINDKADGGGPGGVTSVFTRTGDVVAQQDDYAALQVLFDPTLTPNWPSIEVQNALESAYDNIQFLAGSLVLKGVWDANANQPDLANIPKSTGNYWVVTVEGSTSLPLFPGAPSHILPWEVNDRVLYIDDDLNTGFAQLRALPGDFLLLTGGTMLGPILGFVDVPVLPAELTRKDYVDNGLAGKANAADLANYLPLAGGAVNGFTSFARSDTPDGGAVISVQSTAVDDGAKISFLDNVGIEVGSISISNSNDNTSVNSINDANLAGLSTSLRIDNGSSITPVLRADATRVAIGGTGVISDSFYFNLSTLLFSARGDIFAFAGTPEEIRMSDLVTNASKAGTETSVIAGGVSVVTFNTPFADANYSITCSTESGIEEPAPTWNGKTLNGFNLHNHGNVAENIDWVCTPHNDS